MKRKQQHLSPEQLPLQLSEKEEMDVIQAILYEEDQTLSINPIELEQYKYLALKHIIDLKDEKILDDMKYIGKEIQQLSPEMTKVLFFLVLNIENELRKFVCEKNNSRRKKRKEMPEHKQDMFFAKLCSLVKDYTNFGLSEQGLLQKIKEVYDDK